MQFGPRRPPALPPLVRPRSLLPPPPLLYGRARPAPPLRPLAARPRPGERWSGVGPVCLPPAPSPESRSPTERKGEGVRGGGGGLKRPRGGADGDCHPAISLGRGAGAHTARPASPGLSPAGAQGGTAGERPTTSLSLDRPPWVNFAQLEGAGLLPQGKGEQFGDADQGPLAAPSPLPLPSALAAQ